MPQTPTLRARTRFCVKGTPAVPRVFVVLRQPIVFIVPSYRLFGRAKLTGPPKQRNALFFEQEPLTSF